MISLGAHAAILRRVATTAVYDARAAWKTARASPNEQHIRGAFRACVFAARALRKAAKVSTDSESMIREAKRLEAAAEDLKSKLVRIVVA